MTDRDRYRERTPSAMKISVETASSPLEIMFPVRKGRRGLSDCQPLKSLSRLMPFEVDGVGPGSTKTGLPA